MRVLPSSRAARLLTLAVLTALVQGVLTRVVQASLFQCSSPDPCPLLGAHQALLSVLDFPAAQLALLPQLEALARAPALTWQVVNALVWGACAALLGWRLQHRAR